MPWLPPHGGRDKGQSARGQCPRPHEQALIEALAQRYAADLAADPPHARPAPMPKR